MFSRVGCWRSSWCRSQRPATARAIAASTRSCAPTWHSTLSTPASAASDRMSTALHAIDRQQRLSKGGRLRGHPEDDPVGLFHGVLQAGRRVDREESPVVDDGHAAADQRRFGEDVSAEQDGVVGPEGADHLACLMDLARIEAGGGLVEEQDLRRSEERLGQAETLPIALRELEDLVVEHGLQTAGGGDPFDLSGDGGTPYPLHLGHESQVGGDVEGVVERRALGQVADQPGGVHVLGGHVTAGHRHAAGGGGGEPRDHPHGGGLAGAVRAEKSHDLALRNREGEIVDDGPRAVALGDRLEGR